MSIDGTFLIDQGSTASLNAPPQERPCIFIAHAWQSNW